MPMNAKKKIVLYYILGPFGSPKVGAVSAVDSHAGPISNLYRKEKRFIQGSKCEVFYKGAAEQPR